jgi:Zn-dependent protease
MKWSLYLGKVAGIKLFIHWTFLILVAWVFISYYRMGFSFAEAMVGFAFVLTIFACVILHELGHALVARRYKIVTRNITILPIGGMANMERMPEKPAHELWVAIAGPLVNVVLAGIIYAYLKLSGTMPSLEELTATEEEQAVVFSGANFIFNLLFVNVLLFSFNLIPAFPMDGGRILRALLSFTMDRSKATQIAARIGQLLAIGFVFAGFFYSFWLIFIGIFIFLGAGGEASYEATKSILSGYRVGDVLMTKYSTLEPNDPLAKAVNILLDGQDQEFIVAEANEVKGVLTRKNIIQGLHEFGREGKVGQVMQTEFIHLAPEMELKEAFQLMMGIRSQIGPVSEQGRIVGVLDLENINELLLINQALKDNDRL